MSTANQPTVTCLVDDGTGTFPTNVSSRVNLASIEWGGYGRADESTTAASATPSTAASTPPQTTRWVTEMDAPVRPASSPASHALPEWTEQTR